MHVWLYMCIKKSTSSIYTIVDVVHPDVCGASVGTSKMCLVMLDRLSVACACVSYVCMAKGLTHKLFNGANQVAMHSSAHTLCTQVLTRLAF